VYLKKTGHDGGRGVQRVSFGVAGVKPSGSVARELVS
jgi:hypothetical protein